MQVYERGLAADVGCIVGGGESPVHCVAVLSTSTNSWSGRGQHATLTLTRMTPPAAAAAAAGP